MVWARPEPDFFPARPIATTNRNLSFPFQQPTSSPIPPPPLPSPLWCFPFPSMFPPAKTHLFPFPFSPFLSSSPHRRKTAAKTAAKTAVLAVLLVMLSEVRKLVTCLKIIGPDPQVFRILNIGSLLLKKSYLDVWPQFFFDYKICCLL